MLRGACLLACLRRDINNILINVSCDAVTRAFASFVPIADVAGLELAYISPADVKITCADGIDWHFSSSSIATKFAALGHLQVVNPWDDSC
jgi:hypothetical protein